MLYTSKSKHSEDNKNIKNNFFNIPLIGLVQVKESKNNPANYDLSELINNFPDQNSNQITLQVLDNAMSKAGIIKGDFINIDKSKKVKDGDIIVIKLDKKIYIRKYFSERNLVRLETSEEYHSPLVIDPKTPGFTLIGKVTSITRQL